MGFCLRVVWRLWLLSFDFRLGGAKLPITLFNFFGVGWPFYLPSVVYVLLTGFSFCHRNHSACLQCFLHPPSVSSTPSFFFFFTIYFFFG